MGVAGIVLASVAHFFQLNEEKTAKINIEPASDNKPANLETINAANLKG